MDERHRVNRVYIRKYIPTVSLDMVFSPDRNPGLKQMNEGANAAYESAMLPLEVSKDASPFNLKRELNFSAAPNN